MAVLIFRLIILNPPEGMGFVVLVLTGPVWTLFILISLLFLIWYPTLKYKLFNETLILKCGPFRSEISLRDIRKIREKNLKFDVSSTGLKLPGYCLFRVKYRDEDWVRMYSRAVLKDIILIETDREKFGITPKDKEGFLRDILERTGEDKLEGKI
jgi:hypothetical protein